MARPLRLEVVVWDRLRDGAPGAGMMWSLEGDLSPKIHFRTALSISTGSLGNLAVSQAHK